MTNDDASSLLPEFPPRDFPPHDLSPKNADAPEWGIAAPPKPEEQRLWIGWVVGLLVTMCLFADFSTRPLMDAIQPQDWSAVFVYACFGMFPLQAVLLTTWLVFGRTRLWLRLAVHWFIVVALFCVCEAGALLVGKRNFGSNYEQMVWGVFLSLPVASLGLQLSLWPLRLYAGWRLVPETDDEEKASPLSIRDIMLGTALVAASLAAARLAPGMNQGRNGWQFWPILVGSMALLSGMSLPVVAWAMLRLENVRLGYLIVAGYAAVLLLVAAVGSAKLGMRTDPWAMFGWTITTASFAGSLAVALHLVRACGYRLKIGRE